MKYFLISFSCLALFACTNSRQSTFEEKTGHSEQEKTGSVNCYSQVFNKDTTIVRLMLKEDSVSGTMDYIPYEKDTRKGTLQGVKSGSFIKAVWFFVQEGTKDSLPLEFKIEADKLLQKSYSVDAKTGRQFLSDTAKYKEVYRKTACE